MSDQQGTVVCERGVAYERGTPVQGLLEIKRTLHQAHAYGPWVVVGGAVVSDEQGIPVQGLFERKVHIYWGWSKQTPAFS